MTAQTPVLSTADQQPKTAQDFLQRAWKAHVHKNYIRAVGDFRKAMSIEPQSAEACFGLGLSLKMMGKPNDALAAYQKTIQLLDQGSLNDNPARAAMLRRLAQAHASQLAVAAN
ncbi:MAG: hypothetical protein AB1894_06600 [Chloroflexota bacterium]